MKKVRLQIDNDDYAYAEMVVEEGRYRSAADFLGALLRQALTRWQNEEDPEWQSPERQQLDDVVKHYQARERMLKELLTEAIAAYVRETEVHGQHADLLLEELSDANAAMRRARDGEAGELDDGIPF